MSSTHGVRTGVINIGVGPYKIKKERGHLISWVGIPHMLAKIEC